MANSERKKAAVDTEKSPNKGGQPVADEKPGPTTTPTIPDPPANGKAHLISQDGVIGWEAI